MNETFNLWASLTRELVLVNLSTDCWPQLISIKISGALSD